MTTIPRQDPRPASDHAEKTLRSVVRQHEEHHEKASRSQRVVGWFAERLGRPLFVVGLAIAMAAWIGWNGAAGLLGLAPFDPPPFAALQSALSVASLLAVVMVLAAQRHEDHLNKHRDLLALELSLLSEEKTAKIIELIEELRRDSPHIHDRIDATAERMSEPADPDAVMTTIQQSEATRTNPR
jgi:uncharacterized membrane protein